MQKDIFTCSRTDDKCIHVKHKSGLDIYLCEMKGFKSVEAAFFTYYGSVHTTFKTSADSGFITVPAGIAHFLEHKLFENEECGVFEMFAKTGASCNAYTSFGKTSYTFSCSRNYQENLRILLDFVQRPYFTEESVRKELGIIGQEIQMTNDEPEWRVFSNMVRNMYHHHPIRNDIAGTAESISQITPELLYKCYSAFYNLNNMVLSIAGNISADEVLAICDECLNPCSDNDLELFYPDEPEDIVKHEVYEKFPVGTSVFSLGFKCRPYEGAEDVKKALSALIACDILIDSSSDMYNRLLKDGIINSTLGCEVQTSQSYFMVIIGGESEKPEIVRDELFKRINEMCENGIAEKDFRRFQKVIYASLIRELNNVEAVCGFIPAMHRNGIQPYAVIDMLADLTPDDVLEFTRDSLRSDKSVLSVIERMEE